MVKSIIQNNNNNRNMYCTCKKTACNLFVGDG